MAKEIQLSDKEDRVPEFTYIGYVIDSPFGAVESGNDAYFNFWPAGIIRQDGSVDVVEKGQKIEKVIKEEIQKNLPNFGNFHLFCNRPPWADGRYTRGEIYVIRISKKEDLKDFVAQRAWSTKYQVDLRELEQQGKVKRLEDYGLYPVLSDSRIDWSKKTILDLSGNDADLNGNVVLIEKDGILYGPCGVVKNNIVRPGNGTLRRYRPKSGKISYISIQKTVESKMFKVDAVRLDDSYDAEDIENIVSFVKPLLADYETYIELEKRIETLQGQSAQLEEEIGKKLKNAAANTVDAAFDGPIAEKVLQAAAVWRGNQRKNYFEDLAKRSTAPISSNIDRENLVDHLVGSVKKFRENYSRNEILNIFICISQNFLTIFAGEPGTGKTSICKIAGRILGLKDHQDSRFIPVPVERGWTSKRDLIGYYNPLSQTFESNNQRFYDGLRLLDAEGKESQYPFLILLDEANLSPIEHYWSDFLQICDPDPDSPQKDMALREISLGGKSYLKIPPTLRFVATINNDETTEQLSPRLLDRAPLIRLPTGNYESTNVTDDSFVKIISWEVLRKAFCEHTDNSMDKKTLEVYDTIIRHLKALHISISYRVFEAVDNYWLAANEWFEDEKDRKKEMIALDYAVAQRILPKINGIGEGYKKNLDKLRKCCEEKRLIKCAEILEDIIKRGTMGYYQYQ